ncbi:hypothetical protein PTKIN_Ptkin06aG0172000 [Pterospermum kingtungense]
MKWKLRTTAVFLSHLHQIGNLYSVRIKKPPLCFRLSSSSTTSFTSIASTLESLEKYAMGDGKNYVNFFGSLVSFDRMAHASPRPSVVEFNKLLGDFVGMEHHAIVVYLCKRMQLLGITHDSYTLDILINCICHLGSVDFEFPVFGKMLKLGYYPNFVTFSTLISGFCREPYFADAYRLFHEMVLIGYQPSLHSLVVYGLCKIGDTYEARRMLREREERGFQPDVLNYCDVIRSFCKNGFLTEALDFVSEIKVEGIGPNVHNSLIRAINTLINGLCGEGEIYAAKDVVAMMDFKGLRPNVITYNELINGYRMQNEMQEARKVFDSMVHHGCEPNIFSYNLMISGYCKTDRLDEALKLFDEMFRGPFPDAVTFATLIGAMYQEDRLSDAMNLLRRFDLIYDRNGLSNVVLEIADRTMLEELESYVVFYDVVLDGMLEIGCFGVAKELFHQIYASGLKPSLVTYNIMMEGLRCEGLPEKSYELLRTMECDYFPNSMSYNIVIRGFLQSNDLSRGMKILHEMVKKGFCADASTAILLVDQLSKD